MIEPATIEGIAAFGQLNERARQELALRGGLRRFRPDEVLWRMGDQPRGLFVLLEGQVRVVRGTGGRQQVIHKEGPGGILGDVPLFGGGDYPATAIASTRCTALVLQRDAIRAAMHADPDLAFILLSRLAHRLREVIGRLDRLVASSVTSRLAGYLLARETEPGRPFTLGGTQVEVAEELGTVREVIVRTMADLRLTGLIEPVGRGRYRIARRDGLINVASGSSPVVAAD